MLAEDQFQAQIAIDARVANNKEEVFFFEDSGGTLRHLAPATWARQVTALPLAEWAGDIRTTRYIEKP